MLDPLSDLLSLHGFRTGVLAGAAAAVVTLVAALVARRLLPWAGLAFAAATVAAVADRYSALNDIVVDVTVGAAVLVAAVVLTGWLVPSGPWGALVRTAAAIPGALLVADAAATDRPSWAFPTVVAATLLGGGLVAVCDRAYRATGATPVMLAITAFGVYVTTPDTDHAAIMFGAAVPIALLGWPRPLASLGAAGSYVAAAVLAWIVVLDGAGRDGAVVGALACLGALVLEPVTRLVAARDVNGARADPAPATAGWRAALPLVAVHAGLVLVCSRVAGLRTSAEAALVISAVGYAVAGAVLVSLRRRPPAPA
jgi:hypothetical protein